MGSFTSNSPDETFELGRQWAADVSAGWVIGLMGDLGTGKTQLVKGLAAGLGVEAMVNSPTFALLQEHDEGRLPLAHIDRNALVRDGKTTREGIYSMHKIHFPACYIPEFLTRVRDPRLTDPVADLLGPDILGINNLSLIHI